MVPRFSEPNLSVFKCSHNLPQWLDPAARNLSILRHYWPRFPGSMLRHCIQSWPRGGLSSWPMVPTTRNLTAPTHPHHRLQYNEKDTLSVLSTRQLTRAALTPKYPRSPRSVYGTTWSYCETVILWNSLWDDLFNYSSGVPIPRLRCILHVHWCEDCETVPEQHWNKWGTVSKSQCTPPQCKHIIFGIKNESKVQDQSSSELTGILTALKCVCGPNLEILTWIGDV